MDKLLYVAMTGASQNALAQKAHANNLANISTNGFQRDLEQARSMPVFGDSFPARAFAMTERPATDFSEGPLVETGRDLDVAVTGKGFIAVQAPDGSEAYVRTGSLNIDALGVLRAGNGMPVIGNGGPIAIPPEQKVEVGADGTLSIRSMGEDPRVMAEVDCIVGQPGHQRLDQRRGRSDPHHLWPAGRRRRQRASGGGLPGRQQRQRCRGNDLGAGAVPPVRAARQDDEHGQGRRRSHGSGFANRLITFERVP